MHSSSPDAPRVAVVGAGVAGIVAAHRLSRSRRVTLFEREPRLGGHTNTVTVPDGPDAGLAVDTGFIVHNDRTYPLFREFLAGLGVAAEPTDMSFAYTDEATGSSYAGTGLRGLFARPWSAFSPAHWRFIRGITRLSAALRRDLHAGALAGRTIGEYARATGIHPRLMDEYLVPMTAAVWSAADAEVLAFPVDSLARFFENHGLLSLKNRPTWFHIPGGSRTYVEAFAREFSGDIRLSAPVAAVRRGDGGVAVRTGDGTEERFDAVVMATHADTTRTILADMDREETRLLAPWTYSRNRTVLHTDASVLPANRRAWASWNYRRSDEPGGRAPARVTYHMNNLQRLSARRDYFVTLNPSSPIHPERVIAEFMYEHPVFTREAMASQHELHLLNGRRNTFFCGSYFGYGFHEDATRAAVAAANALERS